LCAEINITSHESTTIKKGRNEQRKINLITSLLLRMTYISSQLYLIVRYRLTYENIQIIIDLVEFTLINPLNAELNPICHLLALLSHHILHVSRIRVKYLYFLPNTFLNYAHVILYIATFYNIPSIQDKIHCPTAHVCNFTNLIPQVVLHYFIFVKKIFSRLINKSYWSGETSALRTATIALMLHVKTVFHTKNLERFGVHLHTKSARPFPVVCYSTPLEHRPKKIFTWAPFCYFTF